MTFIISFLNPGRIVYKISLVVKKALFEIHPPLLFLLLLSNSTTMKFTVNLYCDFIYNSSKINRIIYNTVLCVGKPPGTLYLSISIHFLFICVHRERDLEIRSGNNAALIWGYRTLGDCCVFPPSYSFIYLELFCIVLVTFKMYTQ